MADHQPLKYQYVSDVKSGVGKDVTALVCTSFPGVLDMIHDAKYFLVDTHGAVRKGPALEAAAETGDDAPTIGGFMVDARNKRLDVIPSRLCNSAVFLLDFGTNRIAEVPISIQRCELLTSLDLRNNLIEIIPENCLEHVPLRYLNLRNNKLRVLPVLPRTLDKLYAGDNQIVSLVPGFTAPPCRLKQCILGGNRIRILPPTIWKLRQLEELDLRCNEIRWLPQQIGGLQSLKRLILFNNALVTIPRVIGDLSALEHIDVLRNPITEDDEVYNCILHSGTVAALRYLCKRMWWKPYLHGIASSTVQSLIHTVLKSAHRAYVNEQIPRLPTECWEQILNFLELT